MGLRERAIKGLFWSFTQQFGFQLINFVVSIILARILLPEEFGLIGMVSVFLFIGQSLVEGGLSSSLIRTKDPDEIDYSSVFFMNLATSIFVYCIIFVTAPFIANYFHQEELALIIRVLCLTFIIEAFSIVQSTRLNKHMRFKTQISINIPALVFGSLIGILMAYKGFGVWSLVGMNLSKSVFATTLLWIISGWKPTFVFDKKKIIYHLSFGYKLTISGVINSLFNNLYLILIGKYFSSVQVGYYSRALSIQQLPVNNISAGLDKVTFPLLSEINDDINRQRSIYRKLFIQVMFWITPILTTAAVIAEPLFRFLLTEKWLPAVPYFQILCLAGLFMPFFTYSLNLCMVKGRSALYMKLQIVKNLLILFGILVSIGYGIIGLMWAQVAINVLLFIISSVLTDKLIGYKYKDQVRDIWPSFASGLIIGIISFLIDYWLKGLNYTDFARLSVITILAFGIFFALSVLFSNPAIPEIRNFLTIRLKTETKKEEDHS